MAPKIFLAHAREDKPQVRKLYADLAARGLDPWLDEVDLVPGQMWREEIPKAIRQAGVFLACLSSRSVGKVGYVQNEFRLALSAFGERPPGSIFLIPVRLDECDVPDLQIPDRGLSLQDIHWVDLWKQGGFDRLVKAIDCAMPMGAIKLGSNRDTPRERFSFLSGLRSKSIAAKSSRDLQKIMYELKNYLIKNPDSVEAQTLKDRIGQVLRNQLEIELPESALLRRERLRYQTSVPNRSIILVAGTSVLAIAACVWWFLTQLPALEVGEEFRDCPDCPEMVVVPSGSFTMGSPKNEEGRYDDEGPQHDVTIAEPFAMGQYEVTFDEWEACVARGGCNGYMPSDDDWGRAGRQPVINVSWQDANAYVEWLSRETGQPYRLLSEAEWEYAARAESTTRYWWGDDIRPDNANCCKNVGKTTEVGSYPPNSLGLYEIHGNVWEWVEDCWNKSYQGAPDDGIASTSGDCSRRVVRGGSWVDVPRVLRAACRDRHETDYRGSNLGFRVARSLR